MDGLQNEVSPPWFRKNLLKIAPIDRSRRGLFKNGLIFVLNYFVGGDRSIQSSQYNLKNRKLKKTQGYEPLLYGRRDIHSCFLGYLYPKPCNITTPRSFLFIKGKIENRFIHCFVLKLSGKLSNAVGQEWCRDILYLRLFGGI